MLLPLRRLSSFRRRSFSTAASCPPWAMIYRVATGVNPTRGVSLTLAPPPSASFISIPESASTHRGFFKFICGGVHAASADGLLLMDTHSPPNPNKAPAPEFALLVCNPITGQLFRLPDFDGMEKTVTDHYPGLLTQADSGHGPPKRYVAAELNEVIGERRFVVLRFSSETGQWDKLVLPSPLPPSRRMQMANHEVLAFGDRLLWVDVSWGAVSLDPFSDRPELVPVELPGDSMLPDQQSGTAVRQLVKYRRMGVSDGKLRFVEVSKYEPFQIKSFVLDDESGRWTLEHQVSPNSLFTLSPDAKEMPLIGSIDPLNTDILYITVDRFNVSVDMRWKSLIGSSVLSSELPHPSAFHSNFLVPCVLPSFLKSSSIPGKKDTERNKTGRYSGSFRRTTEKMKRAKLPARVLSLGTVA